MKILTAILLAITFTFALFHPVNVNAATDIVRNGSEFIISYFMKNDEEQARTYLASNVTIPELREDTPITRVTGLPSPEENKSVVVAYFDDGGGQSGRIAFIWELLFEEDKIVDIRVVFDGSSPYLNESNLINQFESKSKTNILIPNDYPFEISHIDGNINNDQLELNYRNIEMEAFLQIRIKKSNSPLETLQDNDDRYYTLNNGIKALYKPNSQLIFQYNKMLYSIRMESEENKTFQVDDFLKIANSMKY